MNLKNILTIAFLFGGLMFIQSCGDDEIDTPTVDTSALKAAVSQATDLIATTSEGTGAGQYLLGSQDILQDAIDLAQDVLDNAASTQTVVDNATVAMNAAIAAYQANLVTPIDPGNLTGHWTFDDASGTTVADFSGNNFTGTFGSEALFGGGSPAWTTDRYGNANKAISFDKGAKITVPYNASLNPGLMSISLWINATENRENNRFMGLHSWEGFKFQLQSANKAFFTGHTTEGIFDKDTDPPLELGTWYHVTVTIGDGNTTFYVNGVQTTKWEDTPGTMFPDSSHDLVFGVGSSKYAATTENFDVDKIIPADWGGYYNGALDEVRIYKSVLSESQVSSIYAQERVQ